MDYLLLWLSPQQLVDLGPGTQGPLIKPAIWDLAALWNTLSWIANVTVCCVLGNCSDCHS